ncbi:DUF1674 domain-containing protein [Sphingomonas jatrophae]|uniref:DUF1674 domain-containing protein n=1 Tax=Sphingomonas jatrophae TaxID=1166337 RepID=A0A1I6M8G8_9SPHN|nr:DUF1674 domain-containing protein [Sphingomonas jatrophae]SFS12016.1 Protein of unknown function [Sphingomonas jatrophae]
MGKRPAHVRPPAYLTPNTPVPEPREVEVEPQVGKNGLDPTRYGDWEHGKDGGRIVDF